MKNSALGVALSVLAVLPARAQLVGAQTASHEGLEKFADLTENARMAASLENANQNLSRGYDVASAAPAVTPAQGTPTPSGLEQAPPEQGAHYNAVPPGAPDVEKPDGSAEADKKKKNLQRAVIGGIGGAAVFAVFGFIFGGPVGALAMGALGFGLLAGITHLNNNPI
ncbi:MAG: hypothetical protein FD126_1776 [Elusimicrobia bacterium]|nr:MAG: hypothetical protein FD126_1776 [Elusimicrobiota bacterium]